MDALSFAYWLKGYTEITNGAHPDPLQWKIIQDHLNEVFTKVTPDRRPTYDPTLLTPSVPGCGGQVHVSGPSGWDFLRVNSYSC